MSPFANQQTIPPWPTQETSTTSTVQAPIPPATQSAATVNSELASAIRKHFTDLTQAPEEIQKAMERADKATTKALGTELKRASKLVGDTAKMVSTIKEARTNHRQNWLKHLRDSATSWQKQLQLYKEQQVQYGEQLDKAQLELNSARRQLQQLNKQAAAVGTPTSADAGDHAPDVQELDAHTAFEAEAQSLVKQIQESLQQGIAAAATPVDTMEVNSDEEHDRKSKRQRSMEPFGGTVTEQGEQFASPSS